MKRTVKNTFHMSHKKEKKREEIRCGFFTVLFASFENEVFIFFFKKQTKRVTPSKKRKGYMLFFVFVLFSFVAIVCIYTIGMDEM